MSDILNPQGLATAPERLSTATSNAEVDVPGIIAPSTSSAPVTVTNNPVTVNPVLSTFATAFIQIAMVAFTAFVALGNTAFTPTILIQLGITILGAVGVYLVPIISSAWRGVLKTGLAIVVAALAAVVPFLTGEPITWQDWIVVGGAGLTALATEVGVQVRVATAAHVS